MKYAEKLKDPRWQKKRLQVLERDHWQCQSCGDDKTTLHVHHLYYKSRTDPWDYELDALITLCKDCHLFETEEREESEHRLLEALRIGGFFIHDIDQVADFAISLKASFMLDALKSYK